MTSAQATPRVVLALMLAAGMGVGCSGSTRTDGATDGAGDAATDGATADGGDATPAGPTSILTYGGSIQRTLANLNETQLTVAAVMGGTFSVDPTFQSPMLDGELYTAPLYLPQLTVNGATHDVVYTATQNDTVYAVDAATGTILWHTSLGTPVLLRQQTCGNLNQTGVQGGMVIDPATHTLYAVGYTRPANTNVFTINALDVATGMQRAGYPQPITPPNSNGSTWTQNQQGDRGAITLIGGSLYIPFGGLYGDCEPYQGWVVRIDPANPGPTHQTAFATGGRRAGIWAPSGLSSDGMHVFAATGNGDDSGSLGESVLAFDSTMTGVTQVAGNAGFFTPSDQGSLDSGDTDVGTNGPVVLPDVPGLSAHLIFQGGKAGVGYLLDRNNLGGNGTGDGTNGEGLFSDTLGSSVFGAVAAYSDGTTVSVFVPVTGARPSPCAGGAGGVVALHVSVSAGAPSFAPVWCTNAGSGAAPDAAPAVSANGVNDGILWAAYTSGGTLRAYRIADGTMIYSDAHAGRVRKWVPPMIADGRVFVTNVNTLTMYRLH